MAAGLLMLFFFAVWRIAPIPAIVYAYGVTHFGAPDCGFSSADWWLSALSIPLPLFLNIFFFQGLVKKAIRRLSGGPKSPFKDKDAKATQ